MLVCLMLSLGPAWGANGQEPVARQDRAVEQLFSIPQNPEDSASETFWLTKNGTDPVSTCQTSETTVSFFADLLLWHVTEGSAENWAQEITPVGSGTTLGTATLVDAPFQWNTGIRFGANLQAADGFDVTAYYTNYTTTAHNTAAGEVYSAFLGNFFVDNADGASFGPKYSSGSIDWDFSFQTIDLEIGQTFLVEESLLLRPFIGLKSAIINQSIHSTWRNPIDTTGHIYLFDSATEDLKQDFWGIGPAFGISATLPFYERPNYSLAIFAAPSGSLMYGRWEFQDVYQNDGPTSLASPTPTTVSVQSEPIDSVATMARGTVGLEWNQHFQRVTSSVRLGYETQVWLNQMQFYSYNMGRLNNLMSLQGGVLELSIKY